MTGRARGRGRGRGNVPTSENKEVAAAPAPTPAPVSAPAPTTGGPARGRGRGRGQIPAPASTQPTTEQSVPAGASGQYDNSAAGRGRGRGSMPQPEGVPAGGDVSSRNRGGGAAPVNGNGRNGGADDANGLSDRMGSMRVTEGAGPGGDAPRQRRPNRCEEENLSSGQFNDFRINVNSIRGQNVELVANAISLISQENISRPNGYQYHVDFNPHLDGRKIRHAIIMSNAERYLGGKYVLFDGTTLFTGTLISPENGKVEFDHTTPRGETIRVTCTHRANIYAGSSENLRISGLLMKKGMEKLNYIQFGRHMFDTNENSKIPLQGGFELWPGYSTSVNIYEGGLMLVADNQFKLAAKRTVYDELLDLHQNSRGSPENFQKAAIDKVVGRIVFTPYNQKRHRVDDINFTGNPLDEFEKKGQKISFQAYYQEMYGITIKDAQQPLLISQPKEKDRRRGMEQPILLIPELCHITGISDEQRADFRFTKMMGEFTKHPPITRAKNLRELTNRFNSNAEVKNSFNFWKMNFTPELVGFHGRRLFPPQIVFRSQVDYNANNADFGQALRNVQFRNPVSVSSYAVFYIKQNEQIAGTLNDNMIKAGRGFGVQFNACRAVVVESARADSWTSSIKNEQVRAMNEGQPLKLCVFVLPDNRADRYNAIKKVCYIENPVPSQCVMMKTLSKPQGLMSVVSKLVLQINAKMGGEPWTTNFQLAGLQVFGMDVYHAGKPGRRKSTVGFVSSINDTFSRFHSRAFTNAEEEVHVMATAVTSALTKYQTLNKTFPKYIVMFRDGVGEGQLLRVQNSEVAAVNQVLADLNCEAKLCYVIVTKRIMQRFFARGGKDGLQNPLPGTVVYDTLTKQNRYDFFLSPVSSRQGTVTPTHFNVLWDQTPFVTDNGRLMELAFHLCHMYFNWTGAIRVPAVCQYAHKLAALAGDNLANSEPNQCLADTLFYL